MIKFDENFVKTHRRTSRAKTPILFFLSFSDDGTLDHQGYIFKLFADGTGKAQLFSWGFGDASDEITFTKAYLNRCEFFTSSQSWESRAEDLLASAAARRAKNPSGG